MEILPKRYVVGSREIKLLNPKIRPISSIISISYSMSWLRYSGIFTKQEFLVISVTSKFNRFKQIKISSVFNTRGFLI